MDKLFKSYPIQKSMNTFFSGDRNFTLQQVTRDLSRLSDSYITSGMMYMEIGFMVQLFHLELVILIYGSRLKNPLPMRGNYNYDQSPSPAIIAGHGFW
ncbi:hypothetical protein TcBrA4_0023150 [Trypanosoma cruzi]|nr:hypothetical protein TcBrA4_0023150 [Trypanosoma cruzi]